MHRPDQLITRLGILLACILAIGMISADMALAEDFEWRQLLFEDLESGSDDWALMGNWTVVEENDNHLLRASGAGTAFLLSDAPWGDHRLLLRVRLRAGNCHWLLRQDNGNAYRLTLQATQLLLAREADGRTTPLATAPCDIQPDRWIYLMITLYEDHLMASVNGQELIDVVDLDPLWEGAFGLETDPGSQVDLDDLWFTGMLPLPSTPPDASLVQFGTPDADGYVAVSGAAGCVPANATVYCLNPATLDLTTSMALPDGSFACEVFGPAGATIQINYGYAGAERFFENIALVGSPALLLTVPTPPTADNGLVYTVGSRMNTGHWVAHGQIDQADLQPGQALKGTVQLRLKASTLGNLDWEQTRFYLDLYPIRLFDAQGNQLPPIRNQVSAFLTPSGLPIEAELEVANPWQHTITVMGNEIARQGSVATMTVAISLPIPACTPIGIYRPKLVLRAEQWDGASRMPIKSLDWDDNYAMLEMQDPRRVYPWPLLPPFTVGTPATPRITWAMFGDYSSNSERGIRAQEDNHYNLSPRTVYATEQFILPMHDPYGQPVTYTLEPSLPLTAWGFRNLYERVALSPPSIALDNTSGHMQASIRKPDGTVESLSETALIGGLNPLMTYRADQMDPTRRHRSLIPALDNPGPSDFYRAYSGGDSLTYRFDQYGRHIITLQGEMRDIWGNRYVAGGTYEVWIAELLDLELATLPGVPFEVGDTYAPGVRVQPAMPAMITTAQTLYVNSSVEDVVREIWIGRANRYGYYSSAPEAGRFRFDAPGEYDVLVTASYWDQAGRLWMGAVRGAGVVETPNTALVAHGERGIRSFAAVKRPIWFAEGRQGNVVPGQTDGLYEEHELGGSLHLPYPYMNGDVMWLVDLEGQNSVFPTITFDDTLGETADLLETRVPELRNGAYYYGQFPNQLLPIDRRSIGELPLVTVTSLGQQAAQTYGWPVGQFPAHADQIGYFYTTCMRPGLGVAAQVSESGLGNAFWFADDAYNLQYGQGANGDLAPDYKLNYGGVVFRDMNQGVNQYAIYASCDVYIPVGDEQSNRILPPFQGAAGGPDGGPLMTVRGQDIDLFVLPSAVKPGAVLEQGDTFSFASQVVPTLDAHVTVTITAPSGQQHVIAGQANKIGFFYDPEQDWAVAECGVYTVHVHAEHRGMTSAGPVFPPYPEGSVLGATDETYEVYVVPRGALLLEIDRSSQLLPPAEPFTITGTCPMSWQRAEAHYTVAMAGFILDQGTLPVEHGTFAYTYDPQALNALFPNLDMAIVHEHLSFMPWTEPEMVDTVQLTLAASQLESPHAIQARLIILQGNELLAPSTTQTQHLPLIWRH